MDLGNLEFNRDSKQQAAVRDAVTAVRLLGGALLLAVLMMACGQLSAGHAGNGVIRRIAVVVGLAGMAIGSYGAYLAASTLRWNAFLTAAVVLGALIPLVKLLACGVLLLQALGFIGQAGYVFTLSGPPRRRSAATRIEPGPAPGND